MSGSASGFLCFGIARYDACSCSRATKVVSYTGFVMDAEQIIDDIERLERMFAVPDTRPLSPSDISAANRRHDEMLAHSPWFRLWQQYGVCCRP